MRIYVSTACLSGSAPLKERIVALMGAGLTHIELGAGLAGGSCDLSCLSNFPHAHFLIHNYFPPPSEPFVLNLASGDTNVAKRSCEMAEAAIRLCEQIGAPFYSVHAGFVSDPVGFDGTSFVFRDPRPGEEDYALERFVTNLKRLSSVAGDLGLNLAVENNVCPARLRGRLLFQTDIECAALFERVSAACTGLLLDTGHLNVSSKTLNFCRSKFIESLSSRVFAVHLHDNDRFDDQHLVPDWGSWIFRSLKEAELLDVPIVVEAKFSSVENLRHYVIELSNKCEKMRGS